MKELAEENARNSIPPSDSKLPDAPQREVIALVKSEAAKMRRENDHAIMGLQSRIKNLGLTSARLDPDLAFARFENQYASIRRKALETLEPIRSEFSSSQTELEQFKSENELEREPTLPVRSRAVGLALSAFVAEGLVNAFYFQAGSYYGFLGGAFLALGAAFADVVVIFFLGMLLRYKNHLRLGRRFLGWISGVVALSWIFSYNLLVAHYRDELVLNPENSFARAIDGFLSTPLQLVSFDSWILYVIGILFSFLAFYGGYTFDDRNPGFGRVARAVQVARSDWWEARDSFVEQMIEAKELALEEYDSRVREISNSITVLRNDILALCNLVERVNNCLKAWEEAGATLLQYYRDVNTAERADAPPGYFDALPDFSEAFELSSYEGKKDEETLANLERDVRFALNRREEFNSRLESSLRDFETELAEFGVPREGLSS